MKVKKNIKRVDHNRRFYILIFLLFVIFIISSCDASESTLTTPSATPTTYEGGKINNIASPIFTLPTVTQSPTANPTPTVVENPTTPIVESTLPPTITPAPLSPNIDVLEPIPASDSSWSSIIQRVNELQGFYTLALSPNGELLAAIDSYDESSRVYLWSTYTGDEKWVLYLNQPLATSELVFSHLMAQN